MKVRKRDGTWVDTEVFRPAARHFEEHGCYTLLPEGTAEWKEFWQEELRRREEGYEVGGQKITGHHYHFLNYVPIKRTIKSTKGNSKRVAFPLFLELDYDYFWVVDIAKNGIDEKELKKLKLKNEPLELEGGYHVIVNKARRKGYSYKAAAILSNTYDIKPNSISLVGAANKMYLYPRGTMTMVKSVLDHLSRYTPFGKQRQVINKQDHYKASFIKMVDGKEVEAGYKSEIIARTFNDNPDAARGLDCDLILLDEAGVFSNLELSYAATRPTVEDGDITTGQIIIFGTSGEGSSPEYAHFFQTPQQYKFLSFKNIWEENAEEQRIGFFHPAYHGMFPYVDEAGNSMIPQALEAIKKDRKNLSPASLRARQQEYPLSPSEAFLSVMGNSFPLLELKRQLSRVRSDDRYKNKGVAGYLINGDSGVEFRPDTTGTLIPINSYDIPPADLTGCVVVYEPADKEPVQGQYIIGYDPIFQDNSSETRPSLASAYVMKTYAKFSHTAGTIVASYVGRPNEVDDAHRIVVMLSEYYGNAEIMFENMSKDFLNYCINKKKVHLLAAQPDDVISAVIKKTKVARKYGVHMPTPLKEAGEKYTKSWLLEEIEIDDDGQTVLRLETIYDQGLLEELIKFNLKQNFDRVISLFLLMFSIKNDEAKFRNQTNQSLRKNLDDLRDYLSSKYPKKHATRQTPFISGTERGRQLPVV